MYKMYEEPDNFVELGTFYIDLDTYVWLLSPTWCNNMFNNITIQVFCSCRFSPLKWKWRKIKGNKNTNLIEI